MPAPPRARPPMPAGRRAPGPDARPGPPPGYGAAAAPRQAPRPQMRPRQHRQRRNHSRRRQMIVGVLVVATTLFAGWWLMSRGDSAPDKDFAGVEQRFVDAARAVPDATADVRRFRELEEFDGRVDTQVVVMQTSIAEFAKIAEREEGKTSELARGAVEDGERALRAIERFRTAIIRSNDLANAQDALADLDSELDDLEAKLEQWERL